MPYSMIRSAHKRLHDRAAVCVVIAALVAIGAGPPSAPVHTRLESSIPAAGDTLSRLPERFELRFSDPVNPALSELVVVTPSGDSLHVPLRPAGDDGRVLEGDPPALPDGKHRVLWRAVSSDGHPVSGAFTFVLARAVGSEAPPDRAAPDGMATQEPPEMAEASGKAGPTGGMVTLAFLALASLLGFAGLLWNCGTLPVLSEPRVLGTIRALGWAALVLGAADLTGWTLRVVPPGAGTPGIVAALGAGTGVAGLSRIFFIGLALALLGRRPRAAAGAALAAVLVGAAAGHPAAISPWVAMPANALHVGAASIWLGGLLLLALAPDVPSDAGLAWSLSATARSVSATALLAVILITASGILQSILFVGRPGALMSTPYGNAVLVKSAGLLVLVGFGAFHRFKVLPRMDQEDGRSLQRTVRIEMIVMLVVILVATWLAHVPPPVDH